MKAFRLTYIVLPVAILLISIAVTAYFYRLLPAEVAYHFKNGVADRWLSPISAAVLLLLPQLLFVLLAGGIVWVVGRVSARFQSDSALMSKVLTIMGNMIALPQAILSFAMLDIFSYNSYQSRIMPLWAFALIAMVLGGVILVIYFFQAVRRALRLNAAPSSKERQ